MTTENKTPATPHYCRGCEEYTDTLEDCGHGHDLCDDYNDTYEDSSGYCSFECCMGQGCDETKHVIHKDKSKYTRKKKHK